MISDTNLECAAFHIASPVFLCLQEPEELLVTSFDTLQLLATLSFLMTLLRDLFQLRRPAFAKGRHYRRYRCYQ